MRQAAERLAQVGIAFVPWGADEVNEMLRSKPDLVDDFFGRAWVEHFCGAEALTTLRARLQFRELRDLREQLEVLYAAVFDSQSAIRRPIDDARAAGPGEPLSPVDRFVIIDVAPRPSAGLGDVDLLAQGGLAFEAREMTAATSRRFSGMVGGLSGGPSGGLVRQPHFVTFAAFPLVKAVYLLKS